MFCYPETIKNVVAACAEGAGAAIEGTGISLKGVQKLWAECIYYPQTGAALQFIPQMDDAVAFGSAAVFTNSLRIWANEDGVGTDTLVQQSNAVNYTTVGDADVKHVIFEIDPADMPEGEDCFRVITGALADTDAVTIIYHILPRYPSRVLTAPTAVTD